MAVSSTETGKITKFIIKEVVMVLFVMMVALCPSEAQAEAELAYGQFNSVLKYSPV